MFTAVLFVVSMGCGRDSPARLATVPDTPETLPVEIGTGDTGFLPLTDGEDAFIVFGPQGGWHIWTAVRVRDESVVEAEINLSVRFAGDGTPAGKASSVATGLKLKDGARERAGMTNFLANALAVRGQRVVLRTEVIAADGRHGSDERTVVAR